MCRITGIFHPGQGISVDKLVAMRDSMIHGGPDAAGTWVEGSIGLGHRRLSIIDLSEGANQPFHWRHYVLVYNGEIYNYQEIRRELVALGYDFTTQSDTEVLITAFHEWGVAAPQKFHGMFAFAIWDRQAKKLWLCRDRVGVKPLYVYEKDGLLLFASELKAIMAYPAIDRSINQAAVADFLHYGYIASPQSIYTYVRKLVPGTIEQLAATGSEQIHTYWDANTVYQNPNDYQPEDLEDILKRSFQYRMVADVPVGVFLSGGVDSSLLCAVLAAQAGAPLNTFTIGFQQQELNEAPYARAIAQHLGTTHQELYCSAEDFVTLLPAYFQMYDEPFGDSSGIPTYLVSKLASEHVKVALSADGADELFGGYSKYHYSARFYHRYQHYPLVLRRALANLLQFSLPYLAQERIHKFIRIENWHNKLVKGIQALTARDISGFFEQASGYLSSEARKAYGLRTLRQMEQQPAVLPDKLYGYLGLRDIRHYLEGDILCKVDRASMYTALESREPFLDQDLIEFALSLPDAYKYRDGKGKYLLQSLLHKYLPAELFDRPKHGFRVPIGQWLREQLADKLRMLSADQAFCNRFGLNQQFLAQRIHGFLGANMAVSEYEIWFLFVLYQWDETWNRS